MPDRTHDALIGNLSHRLAPVRRLPAPWSRAALWMLLWAAMAAGLVATHGGVSVFAKFAGDRPDIIGIVAAAVTAAAAVLAAFTLAIPGRPAKWALLPLPSLALWISADGLGCLAGLPVGSQPPPETCFKLIVMMSAPLSLLLLVMLRRAFSIHPSLTATMAGLAAAAAAAVVLDLIHPAGTTVEDLIAHAAAILLVIGVNRWFSVRALAVALLLAAAPGAAQAAPRTTPADRPVVVELFTAQGCSSCPPADEILNELAQTRKDVLPLSLHVEYWNRLGWVDPYSSPEATERQRVYASRATDPTLFTPEMVVDGTRSVIGSDTNQVDEAINAAEDESVTAAAVSLKASAGELSVTVGAGSGRADIVLIGYDRSHTTPVARGENKGRTLTESNVVRSLQTIGGWTGAEVTIKQKRPAGQLLAVLLAAPDGRIIGLAAPGR